jgi:hypothetical protein
VIPLLERVWLSIACWLRLQQIGRLAQAGIRRRIMFGVLAPPVVQVAVRFAPGRPAVDEPTGPEGTDSRVTRALELVRAAVADLDRLLGRDAEELPANQVARLGPRKGGARTCTSRQISTN